MLSVPTEASAFLGIVAICMTFLLVFYMYLTKKFCFNTIGGFPCCDELVTIPKDKVSNNLSTTFSCEEDEGTSDSEDELLKRLKHSTSTFNNLKKQTNHRVCNERNDRTSIKKMMSCRLSENRQFASNKNTKGQLESKCESEKTKPTSAGNSNPSKSADLISLAEKGRIGKGGSSGGSCSSETGSADNEDDLNSGLSKNKRIAKFIKMSQSGVIDEETKSHLNNSAFEKTESDAQSSNSQDLSSQAHSDCHLLSKCGTIDISFAYDAPTKKLKITVGKVQDISCKERGGANQLHVRILLLPNKRQKQKTKVKPNGNPILFNETFTFTRINPEEILGFGVRFRLYGTSFARREHIIGEAVVVFGCVKPQQQETRLSLTLEPRSKLGLSDSRSEVSSLARSNSTGSTHSLQSVSLPELLLGLAYNGTTGRLSVAIIKGSQFRQVTMSRAPDTYVKLSLISSSGQEIARTKTTVRRKQPNPLFKETFVFQVALFQLPDVSLIISVYNKRSMKRKELIGWFSLGNNNSGDEELTHWNDMRDSKGEQICRWHILLES